MGSWHPDQNEGSALANARFQEVKAAFDEIKRRGVVEAHLQLNQPFRKAPSSTIRRPSRPRAHAASHTPFYGFRRDGDSFRDSTSHQGRATPRQATRDAYPLHSIRVRVRAAQSVGAGIVIACAAFAFAGTMLSADGVWRSRNHGRSFDDLMRSLDSQRPATRSSSSKSSSSKRTASSEADGTPSSATTSRNRSKRVVIRPDPPKRPPEEEI